MPAFLAKGGNGKHAAFKFLKTWFLLKRRFEMNQLEQNGVDI